MLKKFLNQIFTEPDNTTFCIVKIGAGLTVFFALFTAGYHNIYLGEQFNMQDFGTGMGLVFGGAGVALGLKKDTP